MKFAARLLQLQAMGLALALCPAAAPAWAEQQNSEQLPPALAVPQIVGSAYDQVSGEYLYGEYHFCNGESGLQCEIEYRDSRGDLIAIKQLDFRTNPYAPALILKDFRRGHELVVDASERPNLVVDAGFDNFVRSQWQTLDQGEPVSFAFLVAGFDRPLKMKASKSNQAVCATHELCLDISLESWFLRLLAKPIELTYARDDRRLLRFRGASDIRGDEGETLVVDISYRYGDEIELAGPAVLHSTRALSF